jgi:hypothetical protein
MTERARGRFDMTAEELERVLLAKQGENVSDSPASGPNRSQPVGKRALGTAVKKGGMLLKGKNPNNVCAPKKPTRWTL